MEQIGLNSNVFAGGKIFHIQTAGNISGLTMQSEIFDAGRVVTVHRKKLDDGMKNITEEDFKETVSSFHQDIAWEIELLFFIRDKIRTVKHSISHNKMGLLFMRKGLMDEAIVEFEHAVEKNPELVESYNNLGMALAQKGDLSDAIDILKKAVGMEPNYADLRNNLGIALGKFKKYEEAMAELQTALKINPNYLEPQLNIATLLLESVKNSPEDKNLPPAAIRINRVTESLQNLITTVPEFSGYRFYTYRIEKTIKLLQSDQLPQAIETIREIKDAIQKPNLDETIHGFYLKFLFGGAGKDEKVLLDYRKRLEKGVEENPKYADLHNSLGTVYLIQCRNLFIKAMTQFKKAYEINPSYKSAYKNFRLVQNDGREFLNLLRAILK
ncbi:tetratricopeptide repeat protein [bacterium]|nr:tetratricopeptide repeat protein [bacterium]